MIEERFLESAVRIRKSYLKTQNQLEFYHRRAKQIIQNLEEILEKVEKLQKESKIDPKTGKAIQTQDSAVAELVKIMEDLELQGKQLEELANPMNDTIEKLALEEQELYRQIKEKHSNLTDEQIINTVKDRIEKEGLS